MHHEYQRIRDQERRIRHHPRREKYDEAPELVTDVAGKRVAEHRSYHPPADKRHEPCGGADES